MIRVNRVGTQIVPTLRQGLFDDGYDAERKCFVGWAGFMCPRVTNFKVKTHVTLPPRND